MNTQRLHDLIKYILAESNQDEDWRFRELGPIHIIKYVYLADMYFAVKNNGETYTRINWDFHHFGPWNLSLYKEIPDAVKMMGGDTRIFESKYDKDGVRFSLKEDCLDDASSKVPTSILFLLRKDIHSFGSATNDLLHYVYTTPPMTNATPGGRLDFKNDVFLQKEQLNCDGFPSMTTREKKKRKKRVECIREKIAQKREEKKRKRIKPTPPRYDEVFFQGSSELGNEFEIYPINNDSGVLRVSPSAWQGNWRKNCDLP